MFNVSNVMKNVEQLRTSHFSSTKYGYRCYYYFRFLFTLSDQFFCGYAMLGVAPIHELMGLPEHGFFLTSNHVNEH